MVKRIGTSRRKTRHKLKKSLRQRGKLSLTKYFQTFETGEKVCLSIEPSIQKGVYFPRFFGKTGIVQKKTGTCYEVQIKDFNKKKTIIAHPVHLKRL